MPLTFASVEPSTGLETGDPFHLSSFQLPILRGGPRSKPGSLSIPAREYAEGLENPRTARLEERAIAIVFIQYRENTRARREAATDHGWILKQLRISQLDREDAIGKIGGPM